MVILLICVYAFLLQTCPDFGPCYTARRRSEREVPPTLPSKSYRCEQYMGQFEVICVHVCPAQATLHVCVVCADRRSVHVACFHTCLKKSVGKSRSAFT